MQSLREQLINLPTSGMITYSGEHVLVADVIIKADQIRVQHPELYQCAIAIHYTNLIEFVTALIAFDGWCSAIYLCPPNVSTPQVEILNWPLENVSGCTHAAVVTTDLITNSLSCTSTDVLQTMWHLATSGTTGEPKWFSHSFLSLTASTKRSEKLQALCWGLLYQPYRFAGLQVVLQALISGADLVDVVGYEPFVQMTVLEQGKVTAVSATPSFWRQMLMTGKLGTLRLSYITLGGEIADQSVLDKLKRLFPRATLRHIYASTETGVGFVVSDGLTGFPVKWLDDPSLPVPLKISDKQNLLVKPNHSICQNLAQQTDAQGYVDTLDRIHISDDRVVFLGRATGTINVGGNKVHPEKVEQLLLQCPDVSQVKVYAKKNPILGALVVADIMLIINANEQEVKQQVLKMCKNQLQRFEIPTKINIVNNIAHDASGKLNRLINE